MKQKITFALLMGIVTTGIISFTLISVNIGYGAQFFRIWLRSWGLAYIVVIPCILLLGPVVEKIAAKLVGPAINKKPEVIH
jgi:hypothetical protein